MAIERLQLFNPHGHGCIPGQRFGARQIESQVSSKLWEYWQDGG